MSYADGLLSTGERISYRQKQHPFIFVWGARYAILAVIIAILALVFRSGLGPDTSNGIFGQLLGWIVAILFIGGIAVAIWTALRYVNQEYVLTNRRVLQVEGVLNRNSTDSSLEKINDAVLSQSIFGRMFDFGDLTVLTASESGIDKMRMLRGPIAFKKAMLDAKHEAEVDMERAGWAPAPPIRDAGAQGAPVGPSGTPAAPVSASDSPTSSVATVGGLAPTAAAPRADPDEVTRTLANLADLRDRGAITPEEYEAKKADLLSRL
jgi:hypothetical protein